MNRRLTRERSSLHNKKSVSAKSDRAEGATHGDGTTGVNEEQFQIRVSKNLGFFCCRFQI